MPELVVLTRPREDTVVLKDLLEKRGCDVLALPCIRTEPLDDTSALEDAIAALEPDDLLVLTSRAGVDAVMACRTAVRSAVAVIGPATYQRASRAGLNVTFHPSEPNGITLARELPLSHTGRVVLARSDLADRELPDLLLRRGARVVEVVAYRTIPGVEGDVAAVSELLARRRATIGVASPSAARALASAFDPALLRQQTFVAVGRRTAAEVRERIGVEPVIALSTDPAVLAAVMAPFPEEVKA